MDNVLIDVIIPCLKQDLYLLNLCIIGIRKNVVDKIKDIYIVSPNDEEIIEFCQQHNLIFIDENTIFDFGIKDIHNIRPGWTFQQLIKLNGNIGTCENFLCIDADHILLNPHKFINEDNTYNFYYDEEYYDPYFVSLREISNNKYDKLFEHSFISDKMIFNKTKLNEFKKELEDINNDKWYNILLNVYDEEWGHSISEFEFYGTWLLYNYKEIMKFIYCNRKMSHVKIENLSYEDIKLNHSKYDSITQHKFAA